MTTYPQDANRTNDGVATTNQYGDRGDGTSSWFGVRRVFNGGDTAQGATDDAAETDPSATATVVQLLKGLLTFLRVSAAGLGKAEDAAHVSGDTGVMALAVRADVAAAGGANGDYVPLQTDDTGQLRTADAALIPTIANATTSALATNLVVKASAGNLKGFQGYSTTAQFIQVHDAASLPADTAVPELVFPIEADAPFSIDLGRFGREFSTGIVICCSTSGPTKTLGAADCWIDAQYV